jgi:hypothetical protein
MFTSLNEFNKSFQNYQPSPPAKPEGATALKGLRPGTKFVLADDTSKEYIVLSASKLNANDINVGLIDGSGRTELSGDTNVIIKETLSVGPNGLTDHGDENNPQTVIKAINSLMHKSDEEILNALFYYEPAPEIGQETLASMDEESRERAIDEFRHDCMYAVDNIDEFIELSGPAIAHMLAEPKLLMAAVASYTSNGDPLEYSGLSERYKKTNEEFVSTVEEFNESDLQKAMDVFTAQQKLPNMKISIEANNTVKGLSEVYTEDELGVLKHGFKQAQLQFRTTPLNQMNTIFCYFQFVCTDFHNGTSKKTHEFAYYVNGQPLVVHYDRDSKKFLTGTHEKRVTGYNTKRKGK